MPSIQRRYRENNIERDADNNARNLEIAFIIFGVDKEEDAIDYFFDHADNVVSKQEVDGMSIESVFVESRLGKTSWGIIARYTRADLINDITPESEPEYSFEIGESSKHVEIPLEHIATFPPTEPYPGVINFSIEENGTPRVDGVDIPMADFTFQETHYFTSAQMSTNYLRRLAALYSCMNEAPWRGYQAGEVLFKGATGRKRGNSASDLWELTFRFQVSFNGNIVVAGAVVGQKYGHDYQWLQFEPAVNDFGIASQVRAVHVDRVFYPANFELLGIGK